MGARAPRACINFLSLESCTRADAQVAFGIRAPHAQKLEKWVDRGVLRHGKRLRNRLVHMLDRRASTAYTCDTAGGDCITFLVTACTGACKLVWWVWVGIGVGALIVLTVLYKMFCDSSSETTTVIVVQNPVRE